MAKEQLLVHNCCLLWTKDQSWSGAAQAARLPSLPGSHSAPSRSFQKGTRESEDKHSPTQGDVNLAWARSDHSGAIVSTQLISHVCPEHQAENSDTAHAAVDW